MNFREKENVYSQNFCISNAIFNFRETSYFSITKESMASCITITITNSRISRISSRVTESAASAAAEAVAITENTAFLLVPRKSN